MKNVGKRCGDYLRCCLCSGGCIDHPWKRLHHLCFLSSNSDIRYKKNLLYLLINLAFADLFVGITEPIILGTKKFHDMRATTTKPRGMNETNMLRGKRENALPEVWIPGAMQLFSSSAQCRSQTKRPTEAGGSC